MAKLTEGCPKYAMEGKAVFEMRKEGAVHSCTCTPWTSQKAPPERRTCTHLQALCGKKEEAERVAAPPSKKGPPHFSLPRERSDEDPSGWIWTERLDGVRAWWDGKHLVGADGKVLQAPKWFTDEFPVRPMDGHLWSGRGKFKEAEAACAGSGDGWGVLRFSASDAPDPVEPLETRLLRLDDMWRSSRNAFLDMRLQWALSGQEELDRIVVRLSALGAYGVTVRRPGSLYSKGRTGDVEEIPCGPPEVGEPEQ